MSAHSKYLSSLSKEKRESLCKKLLQIQNNKCYICSQEIDEIQDCDIDHIKPIQNGGKDDENNFAITHSHCNRSKQDANLQVARCLARLEQIQKKTEKDGQSANLGDVLNDFSGATEVMKFRIDGDKFIYNIDNCQHEEKIYTDILSKEKYVCIEVPIKYIFHDKMINPRGINSSISKLVKEFYKGNPQLHFSLGRIDVSDENKIKIFDGQHKAVAQILLGATKLFIRLFINPNVDRLVETNKNAGSSLKQVAFDVSIMRQLNSSVYRDKIRKYKKDKGLDENDMSFSENDLVKYFSGDKRMKEQIIDFIKNSITENENNKLNDYIDREGKSKSLPLSYSALNKTILPMCVSKKILTTPMSYRDDQNPRELEIKQTTELMNIIAEEIFINKFDEKLGVNKIENRVANNEFIPAEHLIAYRMSKEEILTNWIAFIPRIIRSYFDNTGRSYNEDALFQQKFDNQIWINIRNFIRNLHSLPMWADVSMSETHFSGKKNYDFWNSVFKNGTTPDGIQVIAEPINWQNMIKE